MFDWATMTTRSRRERPWWEPGTAHGYHVNTFGYLLGEVAPKGHGQIDRYDCCEKMCADRSAPMSTLDCPKRARTRGGIPLACRCA
jgi:hypothetical protein